MARQPLNRPFPPPIRDLRQAGAALDEIAELTRHIAAIEADMNGSIDRIKSTAAAYAAPRQVRLRGLIDGLNAFVQNQCGHEDEKKPNHYQPAGQPEASARRMPTKQ